MDSTQCLQEILELMALSFDKNKTEYTKNLARQKIAIKLDNLSHWIRSGGFVPEVVREAHNLFQIGAAKK